MIRIQNAGDVEDSFFDGRDFGGTIDTVRHVLEDVRAHKDEAVHSYGAQFDVSSPAALRIPPEELRAAAEKLEQENPALYRALCYSRDLALKFARRQKESFDDFEVELEPGILTGQRNIAVDRAGVYVPAGRFPLVSTVVMTVIPAVAAGVRRIVLCTPPRVHPDDRDAAQKAGTGLPGKPFMGGKPYADENIMAAAHLCGVTEAYACGGSQAIGALAFGTESIPRVDVIVGPGNKYVAEAKRLVYGTVGIDMVAGPTEVLIIADGSADPAWVAADLLAQAEHDVVAQPVLVTTSRNLAQKVSAELEAQLERLPTRETAAQSIANCGRIIIADTLEQAAEIANRKAPEHLELALEEGAARDRLSALVHNYGSLFIGHAAAEVLGDYAAGLNHTLPTSGSARFTGGLSVRAFLKTVTTLRAAEGMPGTVASAKAAGCLGDAEGLFAHAHAARIRIAETLAAERMVSALRERLEQGPTLAGAVEAFRAQCTQADGLPVPALTFEAGIFASGGRTAFTFTLTCRLGTAAGRAQDVRMDVRFPPDTVNARFGQRLGSTDLAGDFFEAVQRSDAYRALQGAAVRDFSVGSSRA